MLACLSARLVAEGSRLSRSRLSRIRVTMTRTGSRVAILTLIAPTAPGVLVSAAIGTSPGGWYRLRVRIGGRAFSFWISAGGDIGAG
jgi:uncharacterized membrane protein YdjX (TVP38/TMEM64 family)